MAGTQSNAIKWPNFSSETAGCATAANCAWFPQRESATSNHLKVKIRMKARRLRMTTRCFSRMKALCLRTARGAKRKCSTCTNMARKNASRNKLKRNLMRSSLRTSKTR